MIGVVSLWRIVGLELEGMECKVAIPGQSRKDQICAQSEKFNAFNQS